MTKPGAQLKLIRETLSQASPEWKGWVEDGSEFLTADHIDGQPTYLAQITALNPADAQLIREAKAYLTFMLDLIDKSFAEIKRLQHFEVHKMEKPDKDYTTQCAITCGEKSFIRFLQDQHNLQSTDKDAVAKRVQELCQISSRKQLNQSMEKANNWRRLSREFEGWMRSGGEN